jgi:hypothetical protein
MRRAVDPDRLWFDARRQATRELDVDGHAMPPLPEGCPFGLEEPVGGEADPRDSASRLAAAVAAPKRNSGVLASLRACRLGAAGCA